MADHFFGRRYGRFRVKSVTLETGRTLGIAPEDLEECDLPGAEEDQDGASLRPLAIRRLVIVVTDGTEERRLAALARMDERLVSEEGLDRADARLARQCLVKLEELATDGAAMPENA